MAAPGTEWGKTRRASDFQIVRGSPSRFKGKKVLISSRRPITLTVMAEERSREDDNQRGKSAKKKISTGEKASADDTDVSSKAPSRVHIFKDKPPHGASSKSDDGQLQCSSFNSHPWIHSAHGSGQAAISIRIQPAIIGFKVEMALFKDLIGKGKKALYQAATKAEDLGAIMQALRRTRHKIFKRRQPLRNLRSARPR